MQNEGSNYKHVSIGSLKDIKRQELHEALSLSGVEVSLNRMGAGQAVPFVHSHKQNEEVYVVIEGKGTFVIDGDEIEVGEGSLLRVDPAGQRQIKAADDSDLFFVCIQATAGSLTQFSMTDGVVC
jgi:mannose-6-phosphate isomerase-like protein (cupin superfamily)